MHIKFLSHISWTPNHSTLSITLNSARETIIINITHQFMYLRTCTFLHVGVKENFRFNTHSRFSIQEFYRERPLVHQQNDTSPHQKINFANLFLAILTTCGPLFLHISWRVVIPRCQEGRYWDEFTPYVLRTSILPDMIHSLSTFWLNVLPYSHDSICCIKSMKMFYHQTFRAYLSFL